VRTGTVVCLCKGSDRSLVANIGAALKCEKKFVEEELNNFNTDPKFYYIEGFFIPNKMDICRSVYERYSSNPNCHFITNLNAPYIIKNFQKDITWMVKKADVVFGNRDEFEELAKINGYENMDDLFSELFASYSNKLVQKKIVITDGADDVVFYKGDANGIESGSVHVPKVNKEDIIDTTGAGDSFVAGFIYELIRGKDIRECIAVGIKISSQVIRVIGCNLPAESSTE
jgi:adenosine kinase